MPCNTCVTKPKPTEMKDFSSKNIFTWCTNCGNYGINAAVKRALVSLDIKPCETITCFDIGCNGNGSDKIGGYSFHGLHGRVIPLACGVTLANTENKVIAFGGDGGTYDIGLQSLSGALERGHNFVYVCYDNEGYMNTGIQRSSATPRGAWTTTTPAGKVIPGKAQYHKNLTEIVAAHNIPYVAQANPWRWNDLIEKARKAFYTDGPAFINVLSPCPRGWRFDSKDTVKISKLAVQTNFWPLYEVENGVWKLNYRPKERKPIKEWMEAQGRYRHLFRSENEHIIKEIQEEIDKNWEKLLVKCGEK